MKTRNFLMRSMHMCMLAILACVVICVAGCDEENLIPQELPTQSDVTFNISNDGNGSGSPSSPAEVSNGDTLSMVISQKSVYTDSDGKVFQCEPKASIELFAELDTLYVKDVKQLTDVNESNGVQETSSGENPVVNKVSQTFKIDKQAVCFNLAYDIYTFTNYVGDDIEMPYIKLNHADLYDSETSEAAEPTARSETLHPAITITPIANTKAIVSDTVLYNVNIKFNLDIESMNTDTENKQTLTFSVDYIGAVVSNTEIPDPDPDPEPEYGELAFDINIEGGEGSGTKDSPAETFGANKLNLFMMQKSSYTTADGTLFEYEPKANVEFWADLDTVYVKDLAELTNATVSPETNVSNSGENPVVYKIAQNFLIGQQNIHFNMAYDVYSCTNKAGNIIGMPYVKLNQANWADEDAIETNTKVKSVKSAISVKPLPQTRAIVKDTVLYEVSATFNVDIETVKTEEKNEQTLVFVVKYIGAVVTETEVPDPEPNLVKVMYRTGYEWVEAHDNLPLLYFAHVYRDRYYDNGEVVSDFFVDYGHLWSGLATYGPDRYMDIEYHDGTVGTCYGYNFVYNDSIYNSSSTLIVPDIDKMSSELSYDEWNTYLPDEWEKYQESKLYNTEFIAVDNSLCEQNWEKSDRQSGWYFKDCAWLRRISLFYDGEFTRCYDMQPRWYEQYLVIDGLRIDFIAWRPTLSYSFTHEDFPETAESPRCRVYKYQCHAKYYSRNFYINAIDSVIERR